MEALLQHIAESRTICYVYPGERKILELIRPRLTGAGDTYMEAVADLERKLSVEPSTK